MGEDVPERAADIGRGIDLEAVGLLDQPLRPFPLESQQQGRLVLQLGIPAARLAGIDGAVHEALHLLTECGRANHAEAELQGGQAVIRIRQHTDRAVEPAGIGTVFRVRDFLLDILRRVHVLAELIGHADIRARIDERRRRIADTVRHPVQRVRILDGHTVRVILVGAVEDIVFIGDVERAAWFVLGGVGQNGPGESNTNRGNGCGYGRKSGHSHEFLGVTVCLIPEGIWSVRPVKQG